MGNYVWKMTSDKCSPRDKLQWLILFSKFRITDLTMSGLSACISFVMLTLSASIVVGLFAYTLSFRYPHRKKSRGVRSHERGGQLTGPLREITRSANFVSSRSSVSFAVWLVAPSCWK